MQLIDLTGSKFASLTVIGLKGFNRHRKSVWNCMCECGRIVAIERQQLLARVDPGCGKWCKFNIELRFWSHVNKTDSCWEWTGGLIKSGYGAFSLGGKWMSAHRFSYMLNVGEIKDELQIDHLCRNRKCVNPSHLEVVTGRANTLRGTSFIALNAAKTHCKHGHELSGDNLTNSSNINHRRCKECSRRITSECYARKRVQAAQENVSCSRDTNDSE